MRANRTLYLVTGTCCLHQNSLLKSSCWTEIFLGPGWGSSTFLENAGFHFRGAEAEKCRAVPSHFKQHQPGALKFNPSLVNPWKFSACNHLMTGHCWQQLPRAGTAQQHSLGKAHPGMMEARAPSLPLHSTPDPQSQRREAAGVNGAMKKLTLFLSPQ